MGHRMDMFLDGWIQMTRRMIWMKNLVMIIIETAMRNRRVVRCHSRVTNNDYKGTLFNSVEK